VSTARALAALALLAGCPSTDLSNVDFACASDADCAAPEDASVDAVDAAAPLADAGPQITPGPSEVVGLAIHGLGTLAIYASGLVEIELDGVTTVDQLADPTQTASIAGVAFDDQDRLHTWYHDGTRSIGDARDLRAVRAPAPFPWPTEEVVGVDIDAAGLVHVFDRSGVRTTALDGRGALSASVAYQLPRGKRGEDVAEVAAASDDSVVARYHDGAVSRGDLRDLGSRAVTPGAVAGMAMTLDSTVLLYRSGYAKFLPGTLGRHFAPQAEAWSGDWGSDAPRGWRGYYRLPASRDPWSLVGVAYDGEERLFHLWYRDGLRSVSGGPIRDGVLDLGGPLVRTEAPTLGLVEMALAYRGRVFRWYSDGRKSEGTVDRPGPPLGSTLVGGYRWADVAGIDFLWPSPTPASGTQFSWTLFTDGSIGKGASNVLTRDLCVITSTTPCSLLED